MAPKTATPKKSKADGASDDQILQPVHQAIETMNNLTSSQRVKELEGRRMHRPNTQLTVRVEVHLKNDRHIFLMDVANSVRWAELAQIIRSRCGKKLPEKHRFFCVTAGEVLELDAAVWNQYTLSMWCSHPWVIHAHRGGDTLKGLAFIAHVKMGTALFEKYDINSNELIEERELLRMLIDLHLERLDIPHRLVERFVHVEVN